MEIGAPPVLAARWPAAVDGGLPVLAEWLLDGLEAILEHQGMTTMAVAALVVL
jgi:hypothetical protein